MSDGDGVEPGSQAWELAKLIGRYEETTKTVFHRLEKIDETNGKILESLQDVNNTINKRGHELDDTKDDVGALKEAVNTLEKKNNLELSRNSKIQIIANFVISILNIIATAWSRIVG